MNSALHDNTCKGFTSVVIDIVQYSIRMHLNDQDKRLKSNLSKIFFYSIIENKVTCCSNLKINK